MFLRKKSKLQLGGHLKFNHLSFESRYKSFYMDIVCIYNGLGNQMSQYAFYLAKSKQNSNVYYLNLAENFFQPHNGYELYNVFGISRSCYMPNIARIISKIRFSNKRFSVLRLITKCITCSIKERSDYQFDGKNLMPGNSLINYYTSGWHSYIYFNGLENDIRKIYRFDLDRIGDNNKFLLNQIQTTESVSIHIRRGDYVGDSNLDNVCSLSYYMTAINTMNDLLAGKEILFFVFSDEIDFAKSILNGSNFVFVNDNVGPNSWIDMCLMSNCKHNITANSTFSWWAAWLNSNPSKIVVVPENHLKNIKTPDFYPNAWIKIPSR